jgi:hypothetical protein
MTSSIDATIFSLNINMIMNIVKYDIGTRGGSSTTLINKKWVIWDFLKTCSLKKNGNPHSIPKGI